MINVIQESRQVVSNPTFLSEISLLEITPKNFLCFRLSPEIDRKVGNSFSWRFSQKFPDAVVIWHNKFFWVLAKPARTMPSQEQWREKLLEICEDLKKDIGDRSYSIQWVRQPQISPEILSQLAVRVLKINCRFSSPVVVSVNQVEVEREIKFWAETVEIRELLQPALTITVHSSFVYQGNLEEFYNNHPYRQNPEQLLVGLKVRDIEHNSFATITDIVGTIAEHKQKLLEDATGAISKQALEAAPEDQPVVAVQFGKNRQPFYYAMAALLPCVTAETAKKFDVDYGKLLSATKIPYVERKELLASYKQEAEKTLAAYGFQLKLSVNSRRYPELFFFPSAKLSETKLVFGKNQTGVQGQILSGLSRGGVYRRHEDFSDPSRPIRLAALKLCDYSSPLLKEVRQRLKRYGFESLLPSENKKALSIDNLSGVEARAKAEEAIDELMVNHPDVVLTFLPTSDRHSDDTEGGSLYSWIYSRLLRRGIASQVIYEDTLNSVQTQHLLNQVIPGILAKLGNLPFVLAEPLTIADYFIGLDISRGAKKKGSGTMNACASVRLYGRQGEFIRYRLEDALIEGEEIPQRILESFLPAAQLRSKIVLIYRDGRFCGDEVQHLTERAKAIGSEFILVECYKSGIPRLYNWEEEVIKAPTPGLALRLSAREVILVTTELNSAKMGLPLPLRLRIHEQGHQVSLESLVEATLKLTLL
ncbi:Piwi domain-containing protein, partial [Chroococcidiopsis sp.]|uniref:Piwi domain-containing protein n=1 Tax=Chroococcidiopsis sp. TaxID=3088168 RepID=UPI003F3E03BB